MNTRRPVWTLSIAVGVVLGMTGCSSGDPVGSATPSPSLSPSASAAPSPSVTELPSPTPTATGPVPNPNAHYAFHREPGPLWYRLEWDPSPNEDGTAGSGCAVAESAPLPDGVWRGLIRAGQEGEISFDLVCSYSSDSQRWSDAYESGELDGSSPNEEIIVNLDGTLRTLPLAADAIAWNGCTNTGNPFTTEEVLSWYGQIDYYVQDGLPVWIWVNDGLVTEIHVVYYQ